MQEQISTLALLFALMLTSPACVAGSASVQAGNSPQAQSAAPRQNFIPVSGADLKSNSSTGA
jgi:hypothetical protein